jgi:transcriptional antiterminator NusG
VCPPDWPPNPEPERSPAPEDATASPPPVELEVEEQTPAGGIPDAPSPAADTRETAPTPELEPEPTPIDLPTPEPVAMAAEELASPEEAEVVVSPPAELEPEPEPEPEAPSAAEDEPEPTVLTLEEEEDEEQPLLVWYVLKVQSSREDTIRDALERRVKIQGLGRYFGRIVVPTEKITEIRNNKKRIVERKTYPGYIMVEMELNEKTWFVVRETPGVGDFVGAHGTPTKMTETEVNQMLGQETAKTEEPPKVRIDVERGDRVKIKDGPFENFEGTVEEVIEARGLVKVVLIIFNRPTPVDLEYWQVERI